MSWEAVTQIISKYTRNPWFSIASTKGLSLSYFSTPVPTLGGATEH